MTDTLLKERLQSFIECEGKSCSFDPELITPEYVYTGDTSTNEAFVWDRIKQMIEQCLGKARN